MLFVRPLIVVCLGILVGSTIPVAVGPPWGGGDPLSASWTGNAGAFVEPGPEATCGAQPDTDVGRLIGQVFRCRLGEAGIVGADADHVVAEAVTVAMCESGLDPAAVVFDGRYLHSPHPSTGSVMSAAGVFQFIRSTANSWVVGGYDQVLDPVANVDAAARLYLHNRVRGYAGWADWACYAANDGFAAQSVLPGGPGGPAELPEWAYAY